MNAILDLVAAVLVAVGVSATLWFLVAVIFA